MKTLEEKIEELNKHCNNTLHIIHFAEWEVISYGEGTLFCEWPDGKKIRAETFREAIDLAYAEMKREVETGEK